LGAGEAKKGVTVKAHLFSASAKTKIEAQGGQAVLLKKS
jgi:ribosomal protein L18E